MRKRDFPQFPPVPDRSEILPGLWVGKRPDTYVGYDLVVCCEQFWARAPFKDGDDSYQGVFVHLPLKDEEEFEIPDIIWNVAKLISNSLTLANKVLIHCTGGLNRSCLLAALVLGEQHYGVEGAISLIRTKHHPLALSNRNFERYVLGEPRITEEASMFGQDA